MDISMTRFAWQIGAPAIGGCVPEKELDSEPPPWWVRSSVRPGK
jgi:hypothetical protein